MEYKHKTLYLLPERFLDDLGKFVEYSLGVWDIDDLSDYIDAITIAQDIIVETLNEYNVITACCSYPVLQEPRKRILLPDKPLVFEKNDHAERIMKSIDNEIWDYSYCIKESKRKRRWYYNYYKTLFVMKQGMDTQFFDFVTGRSIVKKEDFHPEILVYGYKRGNSFVQHDVDSYADDLLNLENKITACQYAVAFRMEGFHTALWISLNPSQVPVEEMLSIIKRSVEKHGYNLEVHI